MNTTEILELVYQFIAGGTAVVLTTYLAGKNQSSLGAIVLMFPSITFVSPSL